MIFKKKKQGNFIENNHEGKIKLSDNHMQAPIVENDGQVKRNSHYDVLTSFFWENVFFGTNHPDFSIDEISVDHHSQSSSASLNQSLISIDQQLKISYEESQKNYL